MAISRCRPWHSLRVSFPAVVRAVVTRAARGIRKPVLVVVALLAALPGAGIVAFPAVAQASTGAVESLAGCQANTLPPNDDGSTGLVSLPFTVDFFGHSYHSLYVNNNGNVTFDAPQPTYTPYNLVEVGRVIIAPFFADVDTRNPASLPTQYGTTTVDGHPAFCVNWVKVGYYGNHADKLNSFQLLLVSRDDVAPSDFDIIYNYDQIQWETGDASGGSGGLGGTPARVGFSNGVDHAYELPGSGISGAFLDSNRQTGLIYGDRASSVPGQYIFHVRNGVADTEAQLYAINLAGGGNPASNIYNPCAGDPVNCSTGDYWTQHTDVTIPGRGPAPSWTRTYNSLAPAGDSPFGYGWSSTFTMSLHQDQQTGTVTVTQENGSSVDFTPNGNGTYSAPSWAQASLTKAQDGTWTFRRRERTTFTFDTSGRLTAVSDLSGESVSLSYDSAGHLSRVAGPSGQTITVSTDSNGHITAITDPAGRITGYSYGSAGDLVSVTDPAGGRTTYGYDSAHRLTSRTSPAGGATKNVYDSQGRVTSQTDPTAVVCQPLSAAQQFGKFGSG